MPDIEDVLEDAQREIKSIGDNVKSLKDNMEKNLADVRKIAEDAPKAFAASEQFKKDLEALTAGVLEKHDAIAPKVKALTDGALKADRVDGRHREEAQPWPARRQLGRWRRRPQGRGGLRARCQGTQGRAQGQGRSRGNQVVLQGLPGRFAVHRPVLHQLASLFQRVCLKLDRKPCAVTLSASSGACPSLCWTPACLCADPE